MDWELLADQPLGQKLIKKWFWAYFFMFMVAPTGYLIKVIVSNALSVADVGIFYSIIWFVTLVSLYNDMWLTEALQYFIPKYWIEKKYDYYKTIIYITWILQFITWIGIWILLYFWADWLAINHFWSQTATSVIKVIAFYFIWINLFQVLQSIFYAFQDVVANWIIENIKGYWVLICTAVLFWLWNLNINNFSVVWLAWLIIWIISALIIFIKKYWYTFRYGKFIVDRKNLKIQFKYSLWIFLAANAWTLLGQIDQQIIINLLWAMQAWYYVIFFNLILAYNIIVWPTISLIFPIVIELITKNDYAKLTMMLNILYKYLSVLALSIWGLFIALGPQIAYILFGIKFIYSGVLLTYVWLFLVFNVLFIINFCIMAWMGKAKERAKILWWALLVNIILNILLIYVLKIWLIWAVIAMIAWWIILFWKSYIIIKSYIKIKFNWKYLFINILIIWILTAIILYIKNLIFVLDDLVRYRNFGILILIWIWFYCILWLFNYRSFVALIREIREIKN